MEEPRFDNFGVTVGTKQDSDVRVVLVDPATADPRMEVEAMSSGL